MTPLKMMWFAAGFLCGALLVFLLPLRSTDVGMPALVTSNEEKHIHCEWLNSLSPYDREVLHGEEWQACREMWWRDEHTAAVRKTP
jgi:hypothetical protein